MNNLNKSPFRTFGLATMLFTWPLMLAFAESRLPDLPKNSSNRISAQDKILIKRFEFEGNTVFDTNRLENYTRRYENLPITIDKIYDLRDALTKLYIEAGYINSGVVVNDQAISNGVLVLTVIEGIVAEMKIKGNRWLNDRSDRSR